MRFIRIGLLACFLFIWVPFVHAISVTFGNVPSSVDQNQEVNVSVSLVCESCSDSYLRGVFYKSGSNYFGFTKNNSGNFIGTLTDRTQYFKIAKDELLGSSWSGNLIVKPDIGDPLYEGLGSYMFKVARYTGSGSVTWADPVAVTITGPSSTPTNSPTPTNAPTNSPYPTSTHTPTVTQKPTNTSIPKPTEKGTATPTSIQSNMSTSSGENREEGDVLGAKDENTATSSVTMERAPSYKVFIITFLFIGIGCALLSCMLVIRKQFFPGA